MSKKDIHTHKTKEQKCLACSHKLNHVGSFDEDNRAPQPGDFTICIKCGHIMVFSDIFTLREPNASEIFLIAKDKDILSIQAARKAAEAAMKFSPFKTKELFKERRRSEPTSLTVGINTEGNICIFIKEIHSGKELSCALPKLKALGLITSIQKCLDIYSHQISTAQEGH